VLSQVATPTGGCAPLTTGYLLKPLRGETHRSSPESEDGGDSLLCRVVQTILRRAAQFALNGSTKQTCGTPASGIASAVRVSEISRDGHVIENRQGLTRGADAQPLAGSANLGRRSSTFVDSLAQG
jgi:hypothetical protein